MDCYIFNKDGSIDRSNQKKEITEYISCEICGDGFTSEFRTVRGHYSKDTFMIVRCDRCGLIFVNPRLNRKFRNYCYREEKHLVDYFLQKKTEALHTANAILDILDSQGVQQGNMLEVGCGIGIFLDAASDRGYQVTGLELNENTALYTAKRHDVIKNDIYDVTIQGSSFDVVVMDQTMEHLDSPLKALVRIAEWLKPGGYIFVGVPSVDWLRILIAGIPLPCRRSNALWSPEDHLFYFRESTMQRMLERAGFQHLNIYNASSKWRIMKFIGLSSGYFMGKKSN